MSALPPARLHVFLAREAPFGLILRRGPSKQVCTIGWNLLDDTFQLGQWLNGRTYEYESDLSSDGQHFLYFASKYGIPQEKRSAKPAESWTAVSRTPYLKAVAFWDHTKSRRYTGGGQFLGDRLTYRDKVQMGTITGPNNLPHPDIPYMCGCGEEAIYSDRLRRDGWKRCQALENQTYISLWEKERHSWTLNQCFYENKNNRFGRSTYWQQYEAQNLATGETLGDRSWEWADFHNNRLLWAQEGKIFATLLSEAGHSEITELADFNDWQFQPIQAPY